MLQQIGLVALGGAIGATLRYLTGQYLPNEGFPWPTLSVNLLGSLVLGILVVLLAQDSISPNTMLLLGVGVLGAFTTMSTFSTEFITMLQNGARSNAALYFLANVVLCPLLAFAGYVLGENIAA